MRPHTNHTRLWVALGLAFLSPFGPSATLAQTPPTAGQLLQQATPPPRLPSGNAPSLSVEEPARAALPGGGQRFVLASVRLSGNTVFTAEELLALVQGEVGRDLGLTELDALAQRITRHYRDRGYLLARAYLPAQEIQGGVVHIAVLEGRLGQVGVDNRAGLAGLATAPLERLRAGEPVSAEMLEGALLRLSDLPGVEVRSTLRPGAAVGTSDFLVELVPGAPFTGAVDADSFGNRYTGANRVGATLNWNNPTGLGDQLSLRAQASDGGFGYGRVGYQLPLGREATRVGIAWSHMRYRLGEELDALDARGDAQVASLYLQHPLLRSREASWYATLQYDDKRLTDRVDSTAFVADKALSNWTLGVAGTVLDSWGGGGANQFSLNYSTGRLELDAADAAIDAASTQSAGSFGKWALSWQRQQRLPEGWTLHAHLAVQRATKNLDASEKLSLGGATGVRAYPQGEASGDDGEMLNMEWRHAVGSDWDVMGFYDHGRVRLNHMPWGGAAAQHRRLAGWGVGAAYAQGPFDVRVFVAWKAGTGDAVSAPDRSPRVWAQAAMRF